MSPEIKVNLVPRLHERRNVAFSFPTWPEYEVTKKYLYCICLSHNDMMVHFSF